MARFDTEEEQRKMQELARLVKALRLEKRWSQETLAKRARVHRNTISRMETGNAHFVTIQALERLAVALETPSWKLLKFTLVVVAARMPDAAQRNVQE